MPVEDISRHLANSRMRYATALMQQGRVITDSDWNEMVRLEGEDQRLTVAETVCTEGSPNDGFKISGEAAQVINTFPGPGPAPTAISTYNLALGAGSFYLGGYRFALDPPGENFLSQSDWLTMTLGSGRIPTRPAAARTDIVYLRGWEQSVTSIEDQEFRERALGGPDTSVRVCRRRRVEVLTGTAATTCAEAEDALRTALSQPAAGDTTGPHAFDVATGTERLSKARLTVGFAGPGPDGDPCKPTQVRGYIGAENQAIRVQLTAANQFIWGIDNSAPLYRVQVDPTDATHQTIRFITTPRDRATMPLQGQAVEILPWDAQLDNREKAAATSGFITTIRTTYDPEQQTITLNAGVPDNFNAWLASLPGAVVNPLDPATAQRFFYLRVWTGGAPQVFTPVSVNPLAPPIPLTGTGLELTWSDFGLPGDFWIIAARPNTPDLIVPWRLMQQAPPSGPREFFTVLALIRWTVSGGVVSAAIDDCRERFRSLCRSNGCCMVIVGDGHASHGDFTSINAAIQSLPPSGGEVCVLRGRYEELVTIDDLDNIVIHGCGPDTEVVAPAGAVAAFDIQDSRHITIRDLRITAPAAVGVAVTDGSEHVILRHLTITARDRAAILSKADRVVIEFCDLAALPLAAELTPASTHGLEPLVYVAGDEIRVERNRLTVDTSAGVRRSALGGLQIGGGASDVEVRRNRILEGNGNGITLGSVAFVPAPEADDPRSGDDGGISIGVVTWTFDEDNCVFIPSDPDAPRDPARPDDVPVSEGDLDDIRIIENRIAQMGQSGIAVARLTFPGAAPDLITVRRLLVRGNEILACMLIEVGPISAANATRLAFGGIVLAEVELGSILDNVIEDVGIEHRDPISGVFALLAVGIAIGRNRIRRNGRVAQADQPLKLGLRGGIIIRVALPPTEAVTLDVGEIEGLRQDGAPAAIVHDNVVVAREGRALFLHGLGAMVVTDNQFTAHGSDFLALLRFIIGAIFGGSDLLTGAADGDGTAASFDLILDALGANAVLVWNIGFSNELYLQIAGLSGQFGELVELPGGGDATFLIGGNVLFNDNQVVFDALNPVFTFSLCSTLLFSFDHVTMADNQMDCDLLIDFVIVNTIVFGLGVNVVGNRFKEGAFNCFLSALTLGWMNATALNVATHCVIHVGLIEPSASGGIELRLNPTLADPAGDGEGCFTFRRTLPDATKTTWPMMAMDMEAIDI